MKSANGKLALELRKIPKVEVHLHLDGALSPALVRRLAERQSHPLAQKTDEEIAKTVVVSSQRNSLQEVLDVFFAIYPLLKSPDAIETVAYEQCRDAKANNVIYFETRFAPSLPTAPGFDIDGVLRATLKGLRRGGKDFGVKSGVIVTLLRDYPMQTNEAMFAAALRFKDKGIVALDLANNETTRSLKDFADFFKEAKRQGLGATIHAGEVYPSPDFPLILDLGIDRIGHGVFLTKYPDILAEVARRKIPVEINLTSNLITGAIARLKDHPLPRYLEMGIPVALSTDDPGVFGIDLTHEYALAQREFGLTVKELERLADQGVDTLFLQKKDKELLRLNSGSGKSTRK